MSRINLRDFDEDGCERFERISKRKRVDQEGGEKPVKSHRWRNSAAARADLRNQRDKSYNLTQQAKNIWQSIPAKADFIGEQQLELKLDNRTGLAVPGLESSDFRAFTHALDKSAYFLDNNINDLRFEHLGALMKSFADRSYYYEPSNRNHQTRLMQLFTSLEKVLARITGDDVMALSHVIYALHNFSEQEVPQSLIDLLTKKVRQSNAPWNVQDFRMASFGMRRLASGSVSNLFAAVVDKLTTTALRADETSEYLFLSIVGKPIESARALYGKLTQVFDESYFANYKEDQLALIAKSLYQADPELDKDRVLLKRLWQQMDRVEQPSCLAKMALSMVHNKSNETWVKFADRLASMEQQFMPNEVADILVTISQKKNGGQVRLITKLVDDLRAQFDQLNSVQISKIMHGLKDAQPKVYQSLYQLLTERILEGIRFESARQLAYAMNAFKQKDPGMVDPLLRFCKDEVIRFQSNLDLDEIAEIASSLTFNNSDTATSIRSVLSERLAEILDGGNLGYQPAKAFDILAQICFGFKHFPEHLALPVSALERLLDGAKTLEYEENSLNAAGNYAPLVAGLTYVADQYPNFLAKLFAHLRKCNASEMKASALLREMALCSHLYPALKENDDFNAVWQDVAENMTPVTFNDGLVSRVSGCLTDIDSSLNPELSKLMDGIELDIFFPQQNINIEIDGPFHELELIQKDEELRDEYLEDVYGMTIHRLSVPFGQAYTAKSLAGEVATLV